MLRQGVCRGRMETRGGSRGGRGAAHPNEVGGADSTSSSLQRRRDQVAPLPSRHGESNPEPCRPKADRAARPAGEFAPVILAKEPPAQAAKGGKMAKAEGMRGLRAKAQGNNGLGRWRYELFRALTRACLAGLRTFSTGWDARGGHRHTSGVGPPAYHWAGQSYW